MSNKVKRVLALIVAVIIGVAIFFFVRVGLRQFVPDSAVLRILVSVLAGALGGGIGALIFAVLNKKLNVQEPEK